MFERLADKVGSLVAWGPFFPQSESDQRHCLITLKQCVNSDHRKPPSIQNGYNNYYYLLPHSSLSSLSSRPSRLADAPAGSVAGPSAWPSAGRAATTCSREGNARVSASTSASVTPCSLAIYARSATRIAALRLACLSSQRIMSLSASGSREKFGIVVIITLH